MGALLDLHIDYIAAVDFLGFTSAVDAVGGVDVTVTRAVHDYGYRDEYNNLVGFHIEPGTYHMTGYEALAFARSRKGAGDNDFTRADRQQQVIQALVTKMRSGSWLFNLPDLLNAVGDTVATDVPVELLPALAKALLDADLSHIKRLVIQPPLVQAARAGDGAYILIPDIPGIQAAVHGMLVTGAWSPPRRPTDRPVPFDGTGRLSIHAGLLHARHPGCRSHAGGVADPGHGTDLPDQHVRGRIRRGAGGDPRVPPSRATPTPATRTPPTRHSRPRMAELEGGEAAHATASGMAAIHGAMLSFVQSGDEVLAPAAMYGGTLGMLGQVMPRYGISYRLVRTGDAEQVVAAIGPADPPRLARDDREPHHRDGRHRDHRRRGPRARHSGGRRQHVRLAVPVQPARAWARTSSSIRSRSTSAATRT